MVVRPFLCKDLFRFRFVLYSIRFRFELRLNGPEARSFSWQKMRAPVDEKCRRHLIVKEQEAPT